MYAQKSVTSPLTSSTCCAPETNTTTNQPPFNVKRKLLMFIIYLAPPGLSCGMWDLVPWPGIELRPPAEGDQCLSHWTTRDIPKINLKKKTDYSSTHPPYSQCLWICQCQLFEHFIYSAEYKLQPPARPGPCLPSISSQVPRLPCSSWLIPSPGSLLSSYSSFLLPLRRSPSRPCVTPAARIPRSHHSPEFLPGTYHTLNILFVHFCVCLFMFHLL